MYLFTVLIHYSGHHTVAKSSSHHQLNSPYFDTDNLHVFMAGLYTVLTLRSFFLELGHQDLSVSNERSSLCKTNLYRTTAAQFPYCLSLLMAKYFI